METLTFLITSTYKLKRLRAADFNIYAKSLLKYVTNYTDQVGTVGITEAMQAELSTQSEKFSQLLEAPKDKINKRKVLLATRNQKIDETTELINDVFDLLIKTYDSNSPFVLDYLAASKVVDPATIHRKVDDDEAEVE